MHGVDRNTACGVDRSRVHGTGHPWPQGHVTPGSARTEPLFPHTAGSPGSVTSRLPTADPAAHRGSSPPPPAGSRRRFTLHSADPVCIRSAFIYHLGVPRQGEDGRTDGEDETRDCTFPSSFELFPLFFLIFFSPQRSALLSELEVTIVFPAISVIVFDESLV